MPDTPTETLKTAYKKQLRLENFMYRKKNSQNGYVRFLELT